MRRRGGFVNPADRSGRIRRAANVVSTREAGGMNLSAATPASSRGASVAGRARALANWVWAIRTWGNKISFRRKLGLMGVLVTGLVLVLQAAGWLGAVERRVYDYRARLFQSRVPAAAQYVHLDIDDGSVENLGRWPWPRRVIGDVLRLIS